MAQVKPKANEVLNKLAPSLDAGKLLLSDIEKQQLIRDCRSLPDAYQSLAIEGIIVLLDGQFERGIAAIEESLSLCADDPVTWINFSATLSNCALHAKQLEVLNRALRLDSPTVAKHAMVFGAFWINIDMMKTAYKKLEKYGMLLEDSVASSIATLNNVNEYGEDNAEYLSLAASLVMKIAEKEGIEGSRTAIMQDAEGVCSFTFFVETDDPYYLLKLNSELISSMVDHGLETTNCVAMFESEAEQD
ncbi:hypothetical protein [Mixta calida]|uniref:hypothetical protein n=1 Tax=Mixta calida TaxID=665913 RepID=UPI002FDEE14F